MGVHDDENIAPKAIAVQSQRFLLATPVRELSGIELSTALIEAEVAAARAAIAHSKRSVPRSEQDWGWRAKTWKPDTWYRGRKSKAKRL